MTSGADPTKGLVSLTGAGPGAADLLTLRAARAIGSADVILHDALVCTETLALARPDARIIPVGKRGHRGAVPQDFTNHLMVQLAHEGAHVVRLKGGDPSIFGRVDEERAFLLARGVRVEVIPGVTTATAAAAEFGFSLTERRVARRVLFATGRTFAGPAGDWAEAIHDETTLCLYMACADIREIAAQLIEAGRSPATPALLMTDVSRPGSAAERTTLAGLQSCDRSSEAPAFIVIGPAVRKVEGSAAAASVIAKMTAG